MTQTGTSPFDEHPGFYEDDNRQHRKFSPVTRETIEKKHAALLPPELVKGKSVLDLWSCLWATGQWSLFHGASSYVGVETQPEYVELSRKLLSHHGEKVEIVQAGISEFLEKDPRTFDVVCLFGVIYAFVDCFGILSKASAKSNSHVVVETLYPSLPSDMIQAPIIRLVPSQKINLSNDTASLVGLWSRITPLGLKTVMANFGFFSKEGLVYPERILNAPDIYQPLPSAEELLKMFPGSVMKGNDAVTSEGTYLSDRFRFIMRFEKSERKLRTLEDDLTGDRTGKIVRWN